MFLARWWETEFKKIQELIDTDVPRDLHPMISAIAKLEGLFRIFWKCWLFLLRSGVPPSIAWCAHLYIVSCFISPARWRFDAAHLSHLSQCIFCIGDSGTGKSQIAKLIAKICKKVDKLLTKILHNSGFKFILNSFYGATGTLAGFLQEIVRRYGRCNISVDEQGGIARVMEIDEMRMRHF